VSISNDGARATRLLWYLLIAATVLLCIGFFAPMLTLSKFYFFENSFSVVGGIYSLVTDGQLLIGIVVMLFSVCIPIFKLYLLFKILASSEEYLSVQKKRYLQLMHEYGRWAMLDVLVVAILIVTVKLGAIASIQVHWGLYIFGLAVALIMYLTHKVTQLFNENAG